MATTIPSGTPTTLPDTTWRTRDIVVAAVIGVAFGVAFVLAGGLWKALEFLGPIQNVFYGIWLLPALVAPLIIRKPGAALFAEMVAAGLSAVLGSAWGGLTAWYGSMTDDAVASAGGTAASAQAAQADAHAKLLAFLASQ